MIRFCWTHSCGWYFPVHEDLKEKYPAPCRDYRERDTNVGGEMYQGD